MKDKLKILHVWNLAGVPQVLAKYQRRLGHKSDVITRVYNATTRNISDPNIVTCMDTSAKRYVIGILLKEWKYDIIHVHAPRFYRQYIHKFYPRKKWIAHFHGSDIRGKWNENQSHFANNCYLAVSTIDLLKGCPTNTHWIPNPIDLELFKRTTPFRDNTALFNLRYDAQKPALEQVREECITLGLKLTVVERKKHFVPQHLFKAFLQQFEYYMDTTLDESSEETIANKKIIEGLSLTALQQLAMGGSVVNDFTVIKKFPEVHSAEVIAEQWLKIYKSILR